MNLWKMREIYTKVLPILLFIALLNLTLKRCYIPVTGNSKNAKYNKYLKLANLGEKEINKKNYKRAEEYYIKAKEYSNDLATLKIAELYYNFIDKEEGEKKYKQAYDNGIYQVASILGDIAYNKGDYNLAKEWYLKGSNKGSEKSSIELAKLLISENNITEAKKFLLKVENGNSAEGLYYLMTIYYKEGNKAKIQELKNKMLGKHKMYEITEELMLRISYMLGNEKENKFFELINNADNLIRVKKYEEAKIEYEKSLEYSVEGNYFLGNMYNEMKDKITAIRYYKIAYESGKMGVAAHKIGNIYEESNDISEAKKWYQIGINLDNSQSLVSLGNIEIKEGNEKEAINLFFKGADKKNAEAMFKIVEYYKEMSNIESLKEIAEKIITENGLYYNNMDLYYTTLQIILPYD